MNLHRVSLVAVGSIALCVPAFAQVTVSNQAGPASGVESSFLPADGPLGPYGTDDWYTTGGGAVGDFNDDGWPDLFVISGGTEPDKLYLNDQDGSFTEDAAAWGLGDLHCGTGVAAADYNGDGRIDLYVTSFGAPGGLGAQYGENRLYRNDGGFFTEVAAEAGVRFTATPGAGTEPTGHGAAWGDIDLDGDLDLYLAAWHAPSQANRLYLNDGDGTFTDVTAAAGVGGSYWGYQGRFRDMDRDGWPDLLVSADFGTSRYFASNGDGTFANLTGDNGTGIDDNGMGQCAADFNGDGLFDWYVTSIHFPTPPPGSFAGNAYYLNAGDHEYVESSEAAGCNDGGWGWGTVPADLDNDGWPDIVETNGHFNLSLWVDENAKLFHNNGDGTFDEIAAASGLAHFDQGTGMCLFDYDRDGDEDFVIFTNSGPLHLYRNDTVSDNRWLHLTFDTSTNPLLAPDGFGTTAIVNIEGTSRIGYQDGAPSYLSSGEHAVHFGLGEAAIIDELRIEWPRGYVTTLKDVAVDQHLEIVAPALADLDGDGAVGGADLGLLLGAWGPVGDTNADRKADLDDDGIVDGADLGILLGSWSV